MRWENLNAADEKRFVKDIHSIAKSLEGINSELHAMNTGAYKNDPVKDALEKLEKRPTINYSDYHAGNLLDAKAKSVDDMTIKNLTNAADNLVATVNFSVSDIDIQEAISNMYEALTMYTIERYGKPWVPDPRSTKDKLNEELANAILLDDGK